MIKISIIVPVYNAEEYLEKCLESIINQTYKNIEIISVNDGSIDNSLKILNEYKQKDNRIKVLNQKNSGGVIARKNGIEAATGEYCLIIDADDWIEKNAVELLLQYAEKNDNPDIIKFRYINEPSKIEQEYLFENTNKPIIGNKSEILQKLIYSSSFNNIWNSLIKRSLFDFNNFIFEKIVHKGEDLQINLQLFLNAKKYLIVNDVLYHYNRNPLGITHSMNPSKYISNVLDLYYLTIIRIKICEKLNNKCDITKLKQNLVCGIGGLTINLLQCKDVKKSDLQKAEIEFEKEGIFDFVKDISIDNIKMKNITKNIYKNIINKRFDNIYKYKILCIIYKRIRG